MHKNRVHGFIQLFGANVITKICWALTLLLLMRGLGMQSFGLLATLWSSAVIVAGAADLGTGQVLLREGARDKTASRFIATQSLRLQLAMALTLVLLLSVNAWFLLPHEGFTSSKERAWVIILAVATPMIDRLQALFTVCSQLGGNYTIYTRLRSAYYITNLLALSVAIFLHGGLLSVSIVYFLLTIAFVVFMAFGTWRMLPAQRAPRATPGIKALILAGLPFLGIMTLTLAYGRAEVSILGEWGMPAAAGAYHIAYQVVLLVYSVAGMFFTITYPRLYRHYGDRAALTMDFRDTVRWLSFLGWLVTPPLIIYTEPLMHLAGGAALATYAPMLRVLALLILITPASVALNFLLPMDMLRNRLACDAIGICVAITGAVYAAATSQPVLAAATEVLGYGCAMFGANMVIRGTLRGSNGLLGREFFAVGLRIIPAALLTWVLPLPWWFGIPVFVSTAVLLMFVTNHPLSKRIRVLFSGMGP